MLWTVVAELVGWNPDDVDTRPGEFTVESSCPIFST